MALPRPGRRILSWCLVAVALGCGDSTAPSPPPPPQPVLPTPDQLDDGWPVASLSEARIDPASVASAADLISSNRLGIVHALLIARDGRLVYEGYFNTFRRELLHSLQSVTKSVGSILIGIAVDRGLLRPEETLDRLLPDRASAFLADPPKRAIQLHHLLSMEGGLAWDESTCPYTSPCNDNYRMNESDDWVGYVMSHPVVATPGERFVYNSGLSNTLAAVLHHAVGEDPVAFARRELFTPLGIDTLFWYRNARHSDTLPHFGGGLALRARDLLKLGQLYLDGGVWKGRRIVSTEWVERTGTVHATVGGDDRYGFQWWLRPMRTKAGHTPAPTDMVYGWGYGGQHVFVIAELRLVVVLFGGNLDGSTRAHELLDYWIVPAIR
jgi:CubicO group peptidase (beta-lactamase class C family)